MEVVQVERQADVLKESPRTPALSLGEQHTVEEGGN